MYMMSTIERDESVISADGYSSDFFCKRTYDIENERIEEETVQKEGLIQFAKRECFKAHTSQSDDANLKNEIETLLKAEEKMKNQIQHDDKQFWEFIDKKTTLECEFVYCPA